MHHFDRPRGRVAHDLHAKDGTPVTCGPEGLEKLIGRVRANA